MDMYTKCNNCKKELNIEDAKKQIVNNGIWMNEKIICKDCYEKEIKKLIQQLCKTYNLKYENCFTEIKNNHLLIKTELGEINKEYYGTDTYYFVIDTYNNIRWIQKDDIEFNLHNENNNAIERMIELIKFMCDKY